jgi:hypothetical protein
MAGLPGRKGKPFIPGRGRIDAGGRRRVTFDTAVASAGVSLRPGVVFLVFRVGDSAWEDCVISNPNSHGPAVEKLCATAV